MIEVSPTQRKGAAIGGTLLLVILLGAVINLAGMLPRVFSSATDVEYSFTGSPPSGAVPTFESFRSGGVVFSCTSAFSGVDLNPVEVTCRATHSDASGYSRLVAEIDRRGWTDIERFGDIRMVSSAAPDALLIAIVCAAYLGLAWGLVRTTSTGWGWRELRLLRWRALAYLISPILFVTAFAIAVGELSGLVTYSSENADKAFQSPTMSSMSVGALLFLLLPVFAAAPEEALFRGWLHERLFFRLPTWVAYLVIAELFVLMHLGVVAAMFSSGGPGALAAFQATTIFLISILMTWIRRSGGSVLLCIIAHATYNVGVIGASLSAPSGG